MQKEIYILNGHRTEDYNSFRNRIIELSNIILELEELESLKTSLAVRRPSPMTPLRMFQVLKHTRSFIDMSIIMTYLAAEIHFKSPADK
jgi:hypothetical protein